MLNYLLNFCFVLSHSLLVDFYLSLYCSLLMHHIIVVWADLHDH